MRQLIFVIVLALGFCGGSLAGDWEDGNTAFKNRDYATALAKFKALAAHGDVRAQNELGSMYEKGRGVAQDYEQAAFWYGKAAGQGDTGAQVDLSLLYCEGKGVPKDYVLAHMWANLAASHDDSIAIDLRNYIERKMNRKQIADAQRLARDWKPNAATQ